MLRSPVYALIILSYKHASLLVCRVGEKAIQRIGLAAPSNDANTADIGAPLQSFTQMRDGLKEIQAQVSRFFTDVHPIGVHALQSSVFAIVSLSVQRFSRRRLGIHVFFSASVMDTNSWGKLSPGCLMPLFIPK